ncbi:unnamed protein product [Parascedosporium putredinis]|uniref:Sulfite reductase [NADPH] flavoprotein alpha-component-like FAD-binding domain-containing protein n=1 Tax=Parascedosporium putredinis TaxID=1442378 RepID=A0A9P1GYF4_9PEZI|nr:unnamed protein product [Parascedosporium putredinis]CAI7989919.1 unnamed protein product [Parascedosporium putredinis]
MSTEIMDALFAPTAEQINDHLKANQLTVPTAPSVAPSLTYSDDSDDQEEEVIKPEPRRRRRASTRLIASSAADVQRITGETTAQIITRCCGGGCCLSLNSRQDGLQYERITLPDNDAFRSLNLKVDGVIPTTLSNVVEMPDQTVFIEPLKAPSAIEKASTPTPTPSSPAAESVDSFSTVVGSIPSEESSFKTEEEAQTPITTAPSSPLTRPGAEKRTYHFDIDVTDYPPETGIDFKVGGAIGVMAPNASPIVEEVLDCLLVPRFQRNKPILLKTTQGRWPTVWGEEQARELVTTRRDLLTWCADIQSYPPNKPLLRVLAEHADDENERKLLLFLCAAEGQSVFCDFRTGPHVSISQLLHAFPSSHPPLDVLLSVLQQLMPRFYSLSNDPHQSNIGEGSESKSRRLIEIAVTVHEADDWKLGSRTGVGSGFFERQARKFLEAKAAGLTPEIHVPRRLKTANCANKVWVIQGIRDSLVDEIYSGEWGIHEDEVKKIVESRRGEGRYVQEEVRHQAELVWKVINSVDGRIFVCGSSRGMGEGVEEALVEVAMKMGNLEREEARKLWNLKKEAGQYIAETW